MNKLNGWSRLLSKKLIPSFIREDYTPYDCKVSSNKENYDLRAGIVHAKNILKTMINLRRIPFPSPIQCQRCLFDTRVPNIYITRQGICNMCYAYEKNFNSALLEAELDQFLAREWEPGARYDAIVAYSGGKDSTVSLCIAVEEFGLKVLAVLVDNGFIPQEVIENAREICDRLGVPLRIEEIDFAPKVNELLKTKFATGYPCNVCTALFHDVLTRVCIEQKINRVILGRNWWRILDPAVKGVRIVEPPGVSWNIEFMSLPFVLQLKEEDQKPYLQRVGWKPRNIYGDSTNCLIPGLVEKIVYDRIGYHPELNLLSREIIVGFITKEKALAKISSVKDLSQELRLALKRKMTASGSKQRISLP